MFLFVRSSQDYLPVVLIIKWCYWFWQWGMHNLPFFLLCLDHFYLLALEQKWTKKNKERSTLPTKKERKLSSVPSPVLKHQGRIQSIVYTYQVTPKLHRRKATLTLRRQPHSSCCSPLMLRTYLVLSDLPSNTYTDLTWPFDWGKWNLIWTCQVMFSQN